MFTITFPEGRKYTGTYLTVAFRDGEGMTDNLYLVERLKKKGLTVKKKETPKKSQEKKQE